MSAWQGDVIGVIVTPWTTQKGTIREKNITKRNLVVIQFYYQCATQEIMTENFPF